MTEIVKETIRTQTPNSAKATNAPVERDATSLQTTQYIVYFLFGLLDMLLVFRLVLKLMGASQASGFVRFIYSLTGAFILPFEGIFRRGFTQGIETTSVIEPSTIVAIIVYAILAWGVVKLIQILSGKESSS